MTTMNGSTPRRYWVREHGVHVRAGPGLRQPILTQLARGQTVEAAADTAIPADGHQWLPIRQGEATAFIARELLAESYVRPDPVGPVPVAPELVRAAQGTPLAGHTRALMAIALCESGGRTARDNGGELVHRFEPHQWDRLFRPTLGEPPATWTAEKCHVTSWGVGQIMGWSHATFGCADAAAFRDWLRADVAREYEALVRFCLAKAGVAAAIQTASWEQLWLLYNGGHPQWLPNFQGALQRITDAEPVPQETPAPVPLESGAQESPEPTAAAPPAVAEEKVAAAAPVPETPAAPPDPAPGGLTRRAATAAKPALRGLRYEGGRLLRRAVMLVTLVFTLWQTDVITPGQVAGLLEEAVTPLVTDQTNSVEGRLDHSLDFLETRLAALEQTVQASTLEPAPAVPTPTVQPAPTPEPAPPAAAAAEDPAEGAGADDAPGPAPAPTPAPTSPPVPAAEAACVPRQTVATARYRVRTAPDLQAAVVETLAPGTAVCVQEGRDGWSRLRAPEGWIVDEGLAPLPLAG